MANYIGNQIQRGEFKKLDSIESSFDGSTTTFNLVFNGTDVQVGDTTALVVSLNGVIQEPNEAYTLGNGGSQIVFSSAPAAGNTCFITQLGGIGDTTTPTDGSVTSSKIADGSITAAKLDQTYLTPTGDGSQLTGINTDLVSDTSPQLGGDLDTNGNDINFGANDKAQFGAGNYLQIYHDGSHSYISDQGTGNLRLKSSTKTQIYNSTGLNYIAQFDETVGCYLYTNGDLKLATTSTGVDVTGTVTADGATFTGPVVLPSGANDPASGSAGEIFYNTTDSVFKYHDGTDWYKISATVAKLTSVSGTLYDGKSSTLTLSGQGFLSANLVVNFLQSSDSINVDVTVTPTSDTSASVTVPSSVYSNVTAGNSVSIKVTNSDGSESDTVTITAAAMLGATSSNPASSATALVNDGQTTNGYYYIDLGSGAQSIYCILDGSIESGYGYMRVWDAGSSGSGTTVYHWYTGESDNAAFYNTGGWDFAISEFAIRTRGTWSEGPGYSATTITRYTGNGGSGIHSQYSPKTFNTIFGTGWTYSGTENDNYKNFGYTNTTVLNQLYILDDGDTPCGRQTSCTGTPKGVLSFGNPNSLWADHGNNSYVYDQYVMGLYVR